jgi:hypothetical protein
MQVFFSRSTYERRKRHVGLASGKEHTGHLGQAMSNLERKRQKAQFIDAGLQKRTMPRAGQFLVSTLQFLSAQLRS